MLNPHVPSHIFFSNKRCQHQQQDSKSRQREWVLSQKRIWNRVVTQYYCVVCTVLLICQLFSRFSYKYIIVGAKKPFVLSIYLSFTWLLVFLSFITCWYRLRKRERVIGFDWKWLWSYVHGFWAKGWWVDWTPAATTQMFIFFHLPIAYFLLPVKCVTVISGSSLLAQSHSFINWSCILSF